MADHQPGGVVEGTGIYWESPYAALEKAGIAVRVVNARQSKTCQGAKLIAQVAQ